MWYSNVDIVVTDYRDCDFSNIDNTKSFMELGVEKHFTVSCFSENRKISAFKNIHAVELDVAKPIDVYFTDSEMNAFSAKLPRNCLYSTVKTADDDEEIDVDGHKVYGHKYLYRSLLIYRYDSNYDTWASTKYKLQFLTDDLPFTVKYTNISHAYAGESIHMRFSSQEELDDFTNILLGNTVVIRNFLAKIKSRDNQVAQMEDLKKKLKAKEHEAQILKAKLDKVSGNIKKIDNRNNPKGKNPKTGKFNKNPNRPHRDDTATIADIINKDKDNKEE